MIRQPAFKVMYQDIEIGAAWLKQGEKKRAQRYLSLQIDDPSWNSPRYISMFINGSKGTLSWQRLKTNSHVAPK